MKKRNIIFGFIASVIQFIAYFISNYRLYTTEYLKVLKYMDISYKIFYFSIIPIVLLIIHFSIVLAKKKNTVLTKAILILVIIINSIIDVLSSNSMYNTISIIFDVLLLAYLLKVWFISKIPLNNKIIIVAFVIVIVSSFLTNVYSIISNIQYIDLVNSESFITAYFSSVLSQIAYILIAFYYNNLYFESNN